MGTLVLNREVGERIYLIRDSKTEGVITKDDVVIITLARVTEGRARISIEAPDHFLIHREEVWKKIQEEKKQQRKEIDNGNGISTSDQEKEQTENGPSGACGIG